MKLKKLIKDIPFLQVKGTANPEISGLSNNSKMCGPHHLFISKKGLTTDGALYIQDAVSAGASAILTDLYNPFLDKQVVQLLHKDPASIEGLLAKTFYEAPDEKLYLVGITGTNGKTTTSYLIAHLLEKLSQKPCGIIGTVEWKVGEHTLPSLHTTPDVLTHYKLFSDMLQAGCSSVTLEVSSHALIQNRIKGIELDTVIFTNLTQDHLDYHKTMDSYGKAKALLFQKEYLPLHKKKSYAIFNLDDAAASVMRQNSPRIPITYALDVPADLRVTDLQLKPSGVEGTLHYLKKTHPLLSKLCGRFNVYNILAAIAACLAKGFLLSDILNHLKDFSHIPGRLEKIENNKGLELYVDYAHTEDALKSVLKTLREIAKGRVITVFGCGGSRDVDKRPKMAEAVEAYSDITIVTSDNPRSEDPQEIIRQILTGFHNESLVHIEPDRSLAIKKAIEMALPQDIVLIAGKGHEKFQIFAHQTLPFDDVKEVKRWV